jgi:dihydrofolate reductase
MNLTLIAAIGKNNELGKNNDLIWHLHEDMKFFKENTMGKPIVMGKKTLDSLPKLLPGRKHLVLTHQDIQIEGVLTFKSKEELLNYLDSYEDEVMVIGGASVYEEFLENADRMLLTEIDAECNDADKYFPSFNKEEWEQKVLCGHLEKGISYKHLEYKRK